MPIRIVTLIFLIISSIHSAQAAEYNLAIQPILPQQQLIENFTPLAEYLSEETGQKISILTQRNFLFYWTKMRKHKKGFDLVLDAAHLTDYRVKQLGYTVLAKMPDTVSFSIVTRDDTLILDLKDLIGMRVATMHSPSMGSVRLESLFPNPMRLPHYVYELNTTVAVSNLLSGEVDAAIIPTRLASTYDGLNTLMTTKPVPHMALSASPEVPAEIAEKIRTALVNATSTERGKAMLKKLKIEKFEAADNNTYDGYAKLLKDAFGYLPVEPQSHH